MADACTQCGKCFEVCPITEAAGVADAEPREVLAGVVDILRLGEGNEAARKWASACLLSGECIKACDYGVNPRFMLAMARTTMARARTIRASSAGSGVEDFRKVARDVTHISRMQLDDELLARLGQKADAPPTATCGRISCSTPAATCSRRRTSRCSRSTSWTRSAPPTR